MANTRPMGHIQPSTLFYPSQTLFLPGSETVKEKLHVYSPKTTFGRPFEGNHEADVAPRENEFDTPVLGNKVLDFFFSLIILFFIFDVLLFVPLQMSHLSLFTYPPSSLSPTSIVNIYTIVLVHGSFIYYTSSRRAYRGPIDIYERMLNITSI